MIHTLTPVEADIAQLADGHAGDPEALLPVLQALQARRGSLTHAAIADVARALRLPPERAFGVASFYSMLNVLPEAARGPRLKRLRLCDSPACWLAGAAQAEEGLAGRLGPEWTVGRTSCLGLCDVAPAALAEEAQIGPVAVGGVPVTAERPPIYSEPRPGEIRVMLARAGRIDPDSLDDALAQGAYGSLAAALAQPPGALLAEIEASGLSGRGGAGFPVGRKWRMVAQTESPVKYIVCNADESEPLAFKDRVLIDSDPHLVLEGMALAGYAVGAHEGYIYIRGEYGPQADRLERAIAQAEAAGRLGASDSNGFAFRIHVHRGAGAYICGEETALLESLEGKRGEPRVRPPYPTTHGYRGQPTVVNNVESFAAAACIAARGAAWYRQAGSTTPGVTPGTKLYTLLGHVNRPGLFEAPFGLTLRQIVEDFGGGMRPGSEFHFALAGGAAGVIVPAALLDAPIDYAPGPEGIALGAGAFLVCDQNVSPVRLLREVLHFFEMESCGKCTPCRAGTRQAREILDRLAAGRGLPGDLGALAGLAQVLRSASFCGLGQSAGLPIESALRHFGEVFEKV